MASGYWVQLRTEDHTLLGAGFHITRSLLFTADHCLTRLPVNQRSVVIVHEDGVTGNGEVCERKPAVDLALIRRVDSELAHLPPPADVCRAGDRWRTPNRPNDSDPHLNGTVHEPNFRYLCEGGALLSALQLRSELDLGTFEGYSGSAVERVGAEPSLVGVLQEQYRDRLTGDRAANVLFAVTMKEAMDQFASHFDDSVPEPALCHPTLSEALAAHTRVLEQARDWATLGLISPAVAEMIQIDVARSVVETARQVSR